MTWKEKKLAYKRNSSGGGVKLVTSSGLLELFVSFYPAHIPKSFIITALLSCEWSAASKTINQWNLLIGNVRTYVGSLYGDPTQIFLRELPCEADAERSVMRADDFKKQTSFRNLSISVERNTLVCSLFILSPMWNFTQATGVSVNLPLVWVCLREARWLCNSESPSEKHILRAFRVLNVTGREIQLPSPFTVSKSRNQGRYFIKGFSYTGHH